MARPKKTPETPETTETQEFPENEEALEQINQGDPEAWKLIVYSLVKKYDYSVTTLAMDVSVGCLVRNSTRQGENISEALTFVPNTKLIPNVDGTYKIVRFGYAPPRNSKK